MVIIHYLAMNINVSVVETNLLKTRFYVN